MAPDCFKSKEVYFPHPFWELSQPRGLQERPDGGPNEDCCHNQFASAAQCQTTTCHAETN